jgi:RHS repeat-associated protein
MARRIRYLLGVRTGESHSCKRLTRSRDPLARNARWGRGLLGGLAGVAVIATIFVGMLFQPVAASAALPMILSSHMTEVEEWVYRNGALEEDPMLCGEECGKLWTSEHKPELLGAQPLWDALGTLETEGTDLWASMHEFRLELGEQSLGTLPLRVGWHIGGYEKGAKWMAIMGPSSPGIESPQCGGGWDEIFLTLNEQVGSTFFQEAFSPGNEWYLAICGNSDTIVGQLAPFANPREPSRNCGDNGFMVRGWSIQEWQWNECFEGYDESGEVLAPVTAQAFYKEFHFSRPEDYTHQTVEGEGSHNIQTAHPTNIGLTPVKEHTEAALEKSGTLRAWLIWALEGEHGSDPVVIKPPEEYGGSPSPSAPNKPKCMRGHPVNCATGNQVETQTDLAVGGRGLGLNLTRTYNSQLAASQTSHGPFGYGWTGSYSAHVEVNEELGEATVYQDEGSTVGFLRSGERWTPTDPQVQATLAKEGTGYIYTLPTQTVLHFNSAGQLTSEVDRNSNTTTMNRNSEGRLESISDPSGRKITLTYNSEGLVESAKDPLGHTTKYTYESANLASVTEPGETSANWKFKYDTSHELTEMTDGRSHTVKSEYDSSHRVISQTDALERKRTWEYTTSETGSETKITEPTGAVTVEHFNVADVPTSVTQASGTSIAATTTYEYDPFYNLIGVTDPNGHKTIYSYDAAGNRVSETDALGHTTERTYDATHDVLTTTTPDGEKTTITRNSHGNPEKIERPAPGGKTQTTTYKYDSHQDIESMTDPLEHTTTYEYDIYGDRKSETDPEGNKRTWEYNEDSQEIATVSPRGNASGAEPSKFTTKTERDQRGRPIKITDPLSHTTKYTFDAAGNVETVTDGNSHKTKYTYDADNEETKIEEPSSTILETGYDKDGRITSQTDGLTHTTKYVRNALEEVTEVIDPRERKTTKEYDKAGNLTKVTDAMGRTTTNTYDAANRLTEVSYSDGHTHSIKYEYNGDNRLTHMTDGTGETSYTYDQLDRLTESKSGHSEAISYEYNLANQPTKITYPNTKAVTRTYDKDERLEAVKDWLEHTTKFTYDQDSNLSKITFPTSTSDEDKYTYNDADLMSEVKMLKGTETLSSLAYATRDSDNQVKAVTSKGLPGEEKPEYTYDSNNRLTKGATITYEYSKADNPTKIGTGSYTYSKADELETGPSVTYTYNEVGERTKSTPTTGSATTYGYDQAGNLIAVEKGSLNDTYAYNGNNLRSSQTISGTTTYMAWEIAPGHPLLLSDGTNSYIYGPGNLPIEQINGSEAVLYLHHDQQGSTRLLTGSTGAKEATFTYDAYGNTTGSTGTATTPLDYDGQYTSADTGLIYLAARTYDPKTAQFLSLDPLAEVTRAPYSYAGDDPLMFGDPTGLLWSPIGAGAGGADAVCGATWEIPVLDAGTCGVAGGTTAVAGITAGIALANSIAGEEAGDEGEQALVESEAREEAECNSASEASDGEDISFGHGARHLADTGLSPEEVEEAIEQQVKGSAGSDSIQGWFGGRVEIDGETIEYRGYGRDNGSIEIGTYYPVD